MVRWIDFTNELNALGEIPISEYVYYAYKDGQAFTFDTLEQAQKVSKNVEMATTPANKKARAEWREAYDLAHKRAYDAWRAAVRGENLDLNDATFDLVMQEAYDRGHSSGYDEVASYVDSIGHFVRKILQANT